MPGRRVRTRPVNSYHDSSIFLVSSEVDESHVKRLMERLNQDFSDAFDKTFREKIKSTTFSSPVLIFDSVSQEPEGISRGAKLKERPSLDD